MIMNEKKEKEIGYPPADYVLMYEEQFDGETLNTDEWQYRIEEKLSGLNLAENVCVKDGKLHIALKRETIAGKMTYTCGGIISKRLFGYGYYETKGKLFGKSGLHSSFWNMGLNNGDGVNSPKYNRIIEIDGYEVDSAEPDAIHFNYHWYVGRHASRGTGVYDGIDTSAEEFVVGFEWLPGKVRNYVNGQCVHTIDTSFYKANFYGPQNVWITALAWDTKGDLDNSNLPGLGLWNYFKFYGRDLVGINLVGNGGFEYNTYKVKREDQKVDLQHPIAWMEEGDVDASFVAESENAYSGRCILRHYSQAPYSVSTKQRLEFLMNQTYTFSAMVRSSGGQKQARIRIFDFGREECNVEIPATNEWMKITIDDIILSNNRCAYEFISEANGEQWLEVDQVEFIQKTGKSSNDLLVIDTEEHEVQLSDPNVILIDDFDEDFTWNGEWQGGGVAGYDFGPTSYLVVESKEDMGCYAQWTPNIQKEGYYKVSFFRASHLNSAKDGQLEIVYDRGMQKKVIDFCNTISEWMEIGTYPFVVGKNGYVKLLPGSVNTILRADAVKFEWVSYK